MKSFETFSQLHQNPSPFLLGNIWDVNSAKIFELHGYQALGTSSQAVAKSFGYDDGENLPFETLVQLAKRVVEVINLPLSVDLEGGYTRSLPGILQNIEKLHDAGVIGINLEDSIASTTRQLQPVTEFQKILSAVADHLNRQNIKMFLNIRTDGFLLGLPNPLEDTITRIKSYENSGADGIFVPCITNKNDIKEVVRCTKLPINVMCMPDLPNFKELENLGVRRISMGPFVHTYINKKAGEVIARLLKENNFSCLLIDQTEICDAISYY